jgi:hypothetical protein
MNSLLQTLFMTSEFRSALFGWRYNPKKDGDERLCIPLQLQRLFARLCLSVCPHIETKNVTDSFGWDGDQVFQQQDVQELIRVLLDAIDKTFCANDLDNPITYAATILSIVSRRASRVVQATHTHPDLVDDAKGPCIAVSCTTTSDALNATTLGYDRTPSWTFLW